MPPVLVERSQIAMRNLFLAVGAAGVVMSAAVSIAPAATLTGSELAGLGYTTGATCTTGCSSSEAGGTITLTSTDNVGGGGSNQFQDTATVSIPSAYLGTTNLGTLNNFLTNYTGNVSFNLATASAAGSQYAYWDVELQDPNNSAEKVVLNAFGNNALGANAWNGNSSVGYVFVSNTLTTQVAYTFGSTWSTVAGVTVDGSTLGTWDIIALTVSVGGWDACATTPTSGTCPQTDTINSITLPGTVTATPLPAALPLFVGGLGVMGLFGWRRKQKAQAAA
jgi:hypothetical protein